MIENPVPREDELDPAFKNARREAAVLLVVFLLALLYTILYCYAFGYGREASDIVFYIGIPDWVFWGVFFPWTVCVPVTVWFCFFFMADDDLEHDEDPRAS